MKKYWLAVLMIACMIILAMVFAVALTGTPMANQAPIVIAATLLILPTAFAASRDQNSGRVPSLLISVAIAAGTLKAYVITAASAYTQIGAAIVLVTLLYVLFRLVRTRAEEEAQLADGISP